MNINIDCQPARPPVISESYTHANALWQIQRYSDMRLTCIIPRMVSEKRLSRRQIGNFIANHAGNQDEWFRSFALSFETKKIILVENYIA